jgi:hypothetical protein
MSGLTEPPSADCDDGSGDPRSLPALTRGQPVLTQGQRRRRTALMAVTQDLPARDYLSRSPTLVPMRSFPWAMAELAFERLSRANPGRRG